MSAACVLSGPASRAPRSRARGTGGLSSVSGRAGLLRPPRHHEHRARQMEPMQRLAAHLVEGRLHEVEKLLVTLHEQQLLLGAAITRLCGRPGLGLQHGREETLQADRTAARRRDTSPTWSSSAPRAAPTSKTLRASDPAARRRCRAGTRARSEPHAGTILRRPAAWTGPPIRACRSPAQTTRRLGATVEVPVNRSHKHRRGLVVLRRDRDAASDA
jgi:hypothetical protein